MAHSHSVVIISGMHRSGTSAVTSLLPGLGVDLGDDLLGGDASNPRGYFEDSTMLEFTRRILNVSESTTTSQGHPDWGWTPSTDETTVIPEGLGDEALRLVNDRRGHRRVWGWKDPRTTLLLDFWAEILPEARFLLVYRDPWDVQDSMQRLGHPPFLANPSWGHDLWTFYNRRVASFAERHPDRTVLVHSPTLLTAADPAATLARALGLDTGSAMAPGTADPIDTELFGHRPRTSPLALLHRALWPEEIELLHRLDRAATLPGQTMSDGPPPTLTPAPTATVPVSVVTTVHDDGEFLAESLASAIEAVPRDSELLIVDDGSSSIETLRILDRLDDLGYRIIRQPHAGLSAARNAGFSLARGEYVIPLDADNRLGSSIVEPALGALRADSGIGAAYGDRRLFGQERGLLRVPHFDPQRLVEGNSIDACAVIRRAAWQSVGGYDPTLSLYEDWEFWLALHHQGWRMHHLPMVMLDYRVRPDSLLRRPGAEQVAVAATEIIQARYAGLHRSTLLMRQREATASLAEMERRVADLESALTESLDRQRELQSTIESLRESRDQSIATYEQSRSWRLTKPLRDGRRLVRRR